MSQKCGVSSFHLFSGLHLNRVAREKGKNEVQQLRGIIREICKSIIAEKSEMNEEKELRQVIRKLISEVKKEYDHFLTKEEKIVRESGGLHVIGTERHESRRVDNQLRGRAGRQGDPGSTRFFLSLGDNLLRIFGGERVASLMNAFRVEEDMPIESGMLTRSLEGAQKKVETYYYDIRKQVFEYDEVLNKSRLTFLQRLARYKTVGWIAGYVVCFLAITQHFVVSVVEWWQPRDNIDIVPDICIGENGTEEDKKYA